MIVAFIISEGIFSASLFFIYREKKRLFSHVLAVSLLIDMIIEIVNMYIPIPTHLKTLSNSFLFFSFSVFLLNSIKKSYDELYN